MLTHASAEVGGYVIERHDIVKDPTSGKSEVNPVGIVRLFRKHPKIRYQGAVHERPGDSILAAGFQLGLATQIKLTHLVSALCDFKSVEQSPTAPVFLKAWPTA